MQLNEQSKQLFPKQLPQLFPSFNRGFLMHNKSQPEKLLHGTDGCGYISLAVCITNNVLNKGKAEWTS